MARTTYEKPQRGNPKKLTIDQHVFPAASIARFANLGRVWLYDIARNITRQAKPNDSMFLAKRAWDQRTEAAAKPIEDAFQQLVDNIIAGTISQIDDAGGKIVRDFYALWHTRARHRWLPEQEVRQEGFIGGGGLTPEQEEMVEANKCIFIRADGRMPARFLNGHQILSEIIRFRKSLVSVAWGIIGAHEGEFLVPDMPSRQFIPLTPSLCLVASHPSRIILKQNVVEINRIVKAESEAYFFARDLSKCPL